VEIAAGGHAEAEDTEVTLEPEARAAMSIASEPAPQEAPSPARASARPPAPTQEDISEPPPPVDDEEEGPPSAPRLREGLAASEPDEDQEQEFQEDEGPLKTPPPESGRQHVAAQVAAPADESDDVDISITVTDTEDEPSPPPIEASATEPPLPESGRAASTTAEMGLDMGEPPPRLAFVSEPEIELHVRGRTGRAPSEAPPPPESGPSSAVVPVPAAEARSPSSRPPAAAPSSRPPPPVAVPVPEPVPAARPPSTPPPVRIMAQPGPEAALAAPVEVWASTHAPHALRGQVASFVGQNVSFVPKSFGELLDASLLLGES